MQAAEQVGISRVSARRYLEYLCTSGRAELHPRYGAAGRPEHRYAWTARARAQPATTRAPRLPLTYSPKTPVGRRYSPAS